MRRELDQRDSELRVQAQQIEVLKKEVARLQTGKQADVVGRAEMQAMIAAAMGQPQFPKTPDGQPISKAFDAQTAQINATHVTKEVAKTRRKKAAA
jgi:hypothetical protein